MTDDSPIGTPFTAALSNSVDEWSREVFEALRSWPNAQQGTWSRWEPGYLVLEIGHADGRPIEPVIIDTADDELTVTFGYWETHLPEPLGTGEADAVETVEQAKELVAGWLFGRLKTAVFTDAKENWCGSMLIEGEDLLPQLNPSWIASFNPTQVEVRTSCRVNWRRFRVHRGKILEVI